MLSFADRVTELIPVGLSGRVTRLNGLTVSAADFPAPIGALCRIQRGSQALAEAEVIGFRERETMLIALDAVSGLRPGDTVVLRQSAPRIRVGEAMLGRVFDARGRVIDSGCDPVLPHRRELHGLPPAIRRVRR